MNVTFTRFKPELISQITRLLDAYKRRYPKVTVPPAESYLVPWTEGGRNVICAFDENGEMCGFAPMSLADVPDKPYTFWTVIRVAPGFTAPEELRDALLGRIKERAAEILQLLPARKSRLAFQYHSSELACIDHIKSKGGTYTESVFLMKCNLSQEIAVRPLPAEIEIRYSGMTDVAEQQAYLAIRNKALVEGRPHELANSAVSMKDWQILLNHVYQPTGIFILAYHDKQVVGGVTVFRNEKTGITDDVFVVDEWRRRGIGRYLIREGLRYFKANEIKIVQLEVNSANKRALNLYEQQGYLLADESPFYVINLD